MAQLECHRLLLLLLFCYLFFTSTLGISSNYQRWGNENMIKRDTFAILKSEKFFLRALEIVFVAFDEEWKIKVNSLDYISAKRTARERL